MLRAKVTGLLFVSAITLSVAAAPLDAQVQPAAAAPPAVEVRIETVTYPVREPPQAEGIAPTRRHPALAGKTEYATEAVILENEYVRAVVVPEFGARLTRVTFKKPGRDLLWVNDVLEDGPPWAMGGLRFSFPFHENGRHLDEAASWRLVRGQDGSATVAMDMRFSQYARDTGRFGRFSVLRQATYVTLRPETAAVDVSSRVDNPLPLRHGFRLWSTAQLPRESGARLLLPADAVTDAHAAEVRHWPTWEDVDHSVAGVWDGSLFAAETQGDWMGVHYPGSDANHLVICPRYTAPGARLAIARTRQDDAATGAAPDGRIELWNGSNPHFDHPGHWLPPFGTYIMPMRLAMAVGIGRIDWANHDLAVAYEPRSRGGTVRVIGFQVRPRCRLMARTSWQTVKVDGTLRPDQPVVLDLTEKAEPVLLTVIGPDDEELAEVSLPWQPVAAPADALKSLRAEMDPWTPVAMELADWLRDDRPNIAAAPTALADAAAEKTDAALAAARAVMRTETIASDKWRATRGRLESIVVRQPENQRAGLYLGMMRALESGGKVTPAAVAPLAGAQRLPSTHYFLALAALGEENRIKAVSHMKRCVSEAPPVAMGMGSLGTEGNDRLHPAATVGGEWPALVLAAVLIDMDRAPAAVAELERLLAQDPAQLEAVALLADAFTKAGDATKAAEARKEADRLFARSPQAKRDYDAVLAEARTGRWSGIAKP